MHCVLANIIYGIIIALMGPSDLEVLGGMWVIDILTGMCGVPPHQICRATIIPWLK